MAKIEKPQAIARLDEILAAADALMVARGDLGVEMPLEKVPGLQKRITREARRLGRPVVVATQMLESMISAAAPTRAEGVESVITKDAHDIDDMANRACKFAVRQCLAKPGDRILIIAGMPFGTPGATNMLRLAFVGEDGLHAG
jgi:pyruvate kinase